MADHVCDANCSWMQTPATLAARGYSIDTPLPDAKPHEAYRAERTFTEARRQAWKDGAIRLCTRRPQQ